MAWFFCRPAVGRLGESKTIHMKAPNSGIRLSAILLAASLVSAWLSPVRALGSEYGRLSGTVSDDHGNPLMGATVLIIGPMLIPTASAGDQAERVITDGKGKFAVGNLVPGWYSLQIISPTRLPAHRNGIKVQAGQTSTLRFALGDIFAPLRFQIPDKGESSLGEDWKWVLRTSSATRPLLRYLAGGCTDRPQCREASSARQPASGWYGAGFFLPGSTGQRPGHGKCFGLPSPAVPGLRSSGCGFTRRQRNPDFFNGDGVSKGLD